MQLSPNHARVANLLGALGQLVTDRVNTAVGERAEIGPSYAAGLLTVLHFPGQSVDHLSRALAISHSGAVRLVDQLEADGLVRRERAGRIVSLHTTARGRRTAERIETARLSALADVLAPLSAHQRAALEPVLRTLLDHHTNSFDDLLHTCRSCSIDACQAQGKRCPVAAALS